MFNTEPFTAVVGGRRLDDWATEAPKQYETYNLLVQRHC